MEDNTFYHRSKPAQNGSGRSGCGHPSRPTYINAPSLSHTDERVMGDKRKKKGRSRKKVTAEQVAASKDIHEWAFDGGSLPPSSTLIADEFVPLKAQKTAIERVAFEFHSHSKCSDGYLSPSAVVERANRNGVSRFPIVLSFGVLISF